MADITVTVIGADVASVNMEIIHNVTVIVRRCAKYSHVYTHNVSCISYSCIIVDQYITYYEHTVLDDCQWQLLYSHSIHGVMAVCVVLGALQKGMYMDKFYKLTKFAQL